ncbi:hypothetical protein HK097_005797 [Rhizophlyctis rosea]|uniref:Uncharacterized protein n=1 Tax=Rhizophlyctis rosea TaxID=64517 RepID=A0AAD5S0B0_9FUNG|nr:hypothetical protein HK097_005797 [Rhizophlyctis rosea]
MGGKALKNVPTNRLSPSDFQTLQSRLLPIISTHFRKSAIPPYLPTKQSFGDLDILVAGPKSPTAHASIISHFQSKESVSNGGVTSFEVDGFQVDLISVPEAEYEVALGYLSWGDLGAMIGMVAKKVGLKYGSKGLSLAITSHDINESPSSSFVPQSAETPQSPSQPTPTTLTQIHLSLSHNDILTHLGFNPDIHAKGFATQQDLFTYLTSSTYFLPQSFTPTPSETNAEFRRRLQQRPTWAELATFIENTNPPPGAGVAPELLSDDPEIRRKWRGEFRKKSVEKFGKKAEWDAVVERERLRKVVKSRVGGDVVRRITGKDGKDLGVIMKRIKQELASLGPNEMEAWRTLERMTDEHVTSLILKCAGQIPPQDPS